MDISLDGRSLNIAFNGETPAQKTGVVARVGVLCVDENLIKVHDAGVSAELAANVDLVGAPDFISGVVRYGL
jgi:hypothetical protein